jgi:transposase
LPVKKSIGDCAYGDGATRQSFHDAGIDLSAKVPAPRKNDKFPKTRFILDLTSKIATATCPEDKTTSVCDYARPRHGSEPQKRFRFSAEDCNGCSHREECLRSIDKKRGWGRSISLHPQEELLQEARKRQAQPDFREDIKARQTVERILGRCVQLGARQARYFGKSKTRCQMLMIAIVANLGTIGKALIAFLFVALGILCRPAQSWFSNSNAKKPTSLRANCLSSTPPWQQPRRRPLENRAFRFAF